ncbi:MAG: Flp pilus assembly complex ATPase component TadA [Kiritimatiellae bacterium]|nr:Flp pilus assembly complex ATPase component TadA [Kiritimatiellia bacterium]
MTLEDVLVTKGLLSREDADRALEISREAYRPVSEVLVSKGMVKEPDVLDVLAERHGLQRIDLSDLIVDKAAVKAVSAKLVSHYGIMPVALDAGTITIAVSSPFDMSAAEDIEVNLGYRVERALACRAEILASIRKHYGVGADTVERILADTDSMPDQIVTRETHDLEKMAEDASVVKLVNQLLQQAITDRATDIHFEMCRDGLIARRRIDGVLYDTNVPANIKSLYPAIVSRIKLMSGLDIVERRLPQDGRTRVKIGSSEYDLRISIVPAMHGEDIVIRILPSSMLFDLGRLGFSEKHLDIMEGLISRPHGIIFVTGPTGSGKSTTLYACLSKLNTRDRKIITIEDPVEYELKGITQTQIRPAIGLTFSRALRSMLRHDPDVMMVGEVRDRETADIAVQTAMTGHLVLSTLHTNDAAGAAVRLIDMGVDPYLITSTVQAFIAQRLVRLICPDCKESCENNDGPAYKGRGCRKCGNSGFLGRIAISEFIQLESEICELILQRVSAGVIRDKADSLGMASLADDGRDKVAGGLTTVAEVLRVTSA